MRTVIVNGDALTVADVVDVATGAARAELGPDVPARMETSRAVVTAAIAGGGPVYGVNTGFGALADTRVGEQDLTALQGAIMRSHAAGGGRAARRRHGAGHPAAAGPDAGGRVLRGADRPAAPAARAAGPRPAAGHPGQGLGRRLRRPGPAGAPGPAADRRGPPARPRRRRRAGAPPPRCWPSTASSHCQLAPKEGLSLVNGTEPMQALLAFSVHDADLLVQAADVACALSVEALLGTDRPYDERVQRHPAASGPAGQRGQPARAAFRTRR